MGLIDLTGQRFGRLVVLERAENSVAGKTRWVCRCDCGGHVVAAGGNLKNGHIRSCRCLSGKLSASRTVPTWSNAG